MQNQSSQQLLLLTKIPSGQHSCLCSGQCVFFSSKAGVKNQAYTSCLEKSPTNAFTLEMNIYELTFIIYFLKEIPFRFSFENVYIVFVFLILFYF